MERDSATSPRTQVVKCRIQETGSDIGIETKQVRMTRGVESPGSDIADDDLQMKVDCWVSGNRWLSRDWKSV